MELGHAREHTRITGIIGSEQFSESRQQWSAMVQHDPHAVKDEYRYRERIAGCGPSDLLARITRRHAEAPLLAGRDASEGRLLKKILGYDGVGDVWSIYSGAPQGDSVVAFSTIERCPIVLLFVDYTVWADAGHPPHGADATTVVECRIITYLWGWQRHAWPLLHPLLRSLVRQAIAGKVAHQDRPR